ncbi:UNVERIFIED_CONTAM: Aldehyde oxidase GLOX1 [Sesamum calycinum]|uniref:Aldehyde oxidase GLOX1 n=1 Tax=Sesamum calycinum TaxID=2727403 RepID=A0AAW2JUD7_9LAMI
MENMPMPRVMSDMLILPDGDVIIINGARSGTAGWESAINPVTRPLIYNPNGKAGARFSVMAASSRPRLYHSTAVLLTDGRVLVGGSNPHKYYNFTGVDFPTDLSLESFSPHIYRPLQRFLKTSAVSVRIVAPSFNTHSFSMNQRMVVLKGAGVSRVGSNVYRVAASGPSNPEIAPPGYYCCFSFMLVFRVLDCGLRFSNMLAYKVDDALLPFTIN